MARSEDDEINEYLKVMDMDMDLAEDIDEYVRAATWTPKEIKVLLEMIKPWGSKHVLTSLLFDDDSIVIEDGHDLVKELWKIATQKPLAGDSDKEATYRELIGYYSQAIGALDVKFNKLPPMLGSKNKLVAEIVKWRLKIGR